MFFWEVLKPLLWKELDPNIAPVLGGHRSQLSGVSLQALRQEVCHVSCFLPEANGCEMGGWSMFVENY